MSRILMTLISLLLCISSAWGKGGSIINPVTDVCWKCLFPIHVAGANVTPNAKDNVSYSKGLCFCAGTPPKAGIPLAFWEPSHLVEVTRTPYKLSALGGVSLAKSTIRNQGAVSHVGVSGRSSFYNVHYYQFPALSWLDFLGDFNCIERGSLEITYMSEFDPFWNDDEWASIITPEAHLFASPLAQVACIADCSATAMDKVLDELFWCAGCSGSLYPFVGYVPHHISGIQASHLLVQRLIAKLHSLGMIRGYGKNDFCQSKLLPRLKKSRYKTQIVQPIAQTQGPCIPLGQSELFWGANKSYPYKGEDFVYLIWTKKHCCLDAVKPVLKGVVGGEGL